MTTYAYRMVLRWCLCHVSRWLRGLPRGTRVLPSYCNCKSCKSDISVLSGKFQIIYMCLSMFCCTEACANVWPATEHKTIDHFDIKCSDDQSFDGYDTM